MNNVLGVEVGYTGENLLHYSGCLKISELLSLMNLIVKLATLAQPKISDQILSLSYSNTI